MVVAVAPVAEGDADPNHCRVGCGPGRRRSVVAALLRPALLCIVLPLWPTALVGCRYDAVLFVDPVLGTALQESAVDDIGLQRAARAAGRSLRIVRIADYEKSVAYIESVVVEMAPELQVALVGPFLQNELLVVTDSVPGLRGAVVGPTRGVAATQLSSVVVDRTTAFAQLAGAVVGDYGAERPIRIALLFAAHTPARVRELAALRMALDQRIAARAADVRIVHEYIPDRAADSETVREQVRIALDQQANVFLVFVGAGNPAAIRLLTTEGLTVASEFAGHFALRNRAVRWSIELPYAAAIFALATITATSEVAAFALSAVLVDAENQPAAWQKPPVQGELLYRGVP